MKTFLKTILVASLLMTVPAVLWAESKNYFTEAATKYQAGNFKEAARLYEKIIESGDKTAAAHYNLGNAYFRLGKKGRALVEYERALRIAPRDKNLRWNVQILKSSLADRVGEEKSLGHVWRERVLGFFSMSEVAAIFSICLILLFLFSWAYRISSTNAFKGTVWFLIVIAGMFAALMMLKWQEEKDPRLVILDKEVFVRYGPSPKETKVFLLHEGAKAKVLDRSKKWLYVDIDSRHAGWIPESAGEII